MMKWIEELNDLLNKMSINELEKKWTKYDEFDFGPEIEEYIYSSMCYCNTQLLQTTQEIVCQDNKNGYLNVNENYALAA